MPDGDGEPLRVGVFGAGAIGGYLGAWLSSVGCRVTLVGRGPIVERPSELRAVDITGRTATPNADVEGAGSAGALADVDVCLVAVKSQDTAAAGAALAAALRPDALVVSFQNGLDNAARLRDAGLLAIGGMVTFNVIRDGDLRLRQTTTGPLMSGTVEGEPQRRALSRLAAAFGRTPSPLERKPDIDAVLAGKLLVNLGNGLSAMTGLPTATALASRDYRRGLAAAIEEGLRVLRASGRPVRIPFPLPPAVVLRVLRLPTPVFRVAARSMVRVDPEARSSTLHDLDRGRPTEIDHLNGAIVAIAERAGVDAPFNRWVTEEVHRLERAPRPLRYTPVEELGRRAGDLAR